MPKTGPSDGVVLHCSFCGKSQHDVKKIIAGPGVYICDECIDLCNEIIVEELADDEPDEDAVPTDADLDAAARAVNEAVSRLHLLALRRRSVEPEPQ